MSAKISHELANHRLEQAKEDLSASKILYESELYKAANNRAYYAIFHAIRAVLSLEPIDFRKHKDVIAYFNKNYVNTGKFPKEIGRKIAIASHTREDSDYDDQFIGSANDTENQIETAELLIGLVEKFLNK